MFIDPENRANPHSPDAAATAALPPMFSSFAGITVNLNDISYDDWARSAVDAPKAMDGTELRAKFYAKGAAHKIELLGSVDRNGPPMAVNPKDYAAVYDMALRHRYRRIIFQGFCLASDYELGHNGGDNSGVEIEIAGKLSVPNSSGRAIRIGTTLGLRLPNYEEIMNGGAAVVGRGKQRHHGAGAGPGNGVRARLAPMQSEYNAAAGRYAWYLTPNTSTLPVLDDGIPDPVSGFIIGPFAHTINKNSYPGSPCDVVMG
jgi:hypothetical protein